MVPRVQHEVNQVNHVPKVDTVHQFPRPSCVVGEPDQVSIRCIALMNTKWLSTPQCGGGGVIVEPASLSDSEVFLWHEIEKD